MPLRKSRIEEIGEESRRRIMDAAEELFAEKGFSRTSFVDVAERSGISRGSIPWHFANKDGLLIAVVERAVDQLMPPGSIAASGPGGVREVFDRLKEWMRGPTAGVLYMLLTEAISSDSPVHTHYVEFFRTRRKAAGYAISSATGSPRRSNADREALDLLLTVVNGAVFGIGLQYQLDPALDLDACMETLARLTEAALGIGPIPAPKSDPQGHR
ncbi:TetR family transcriptional regulator [Antricoccus suffuscus]|uniref:TetR family transcriptional regulator n=1 Tax=Antricoccus suffuscus TaxID=1629062 RepID=A0A2T0ZTP5_9ACTN|nr:TetR/AcrR family transcriptional regulator [Antricoccus suffuscus]PRZ39693.1 TetR family transcriptional regulator [Antricoccus suffuscus]